MMALLMHVFICEGWGGDAVTNVRLTLWSGLV